MSQPASFDKPREGELVLVCPHPRRRLVSIYVGDEYGIGMFIKTAEVGDFWIRWVCLCWWCNFWRWLRRRSPVEAATHRAEWGDQR